MMDEKKIDILRKELAKILDVSLTHIVRVNEQVKHLDSLFGVLYMKRDEARENVALSIEQMQRAVNAATADLEAELNIALCHKEGALKHQKERVVDHIKTTASGCYRIEELLETGREAELLAVGNKMLRSMKELVEFKAEDTFDNISSLKFVPTWDVLKKNILKSGSIGYLQTTSISPKDAHIINHDGSFTSKMFVGIEEIIHITMGKDYVQSAVEHFKITFGPVSGEREFVQVIDNKDCSLSGLFVADVSGDYQLSITLYGEQITGSPFNIAVLDFDTTSEIGSEGLDGMRDVGSPGTAKSKRKGLRPRLSLHSLKEVNKHLAQNPPVPERSLFQKPQNSSQQQGFNSKRDETFQPENASKRGKEPFRTLSDAIETQKRKKKQALSSPKQKKPAQKKLEEQHNSLDVPLRKPWMKESPKKPDIKLYDHPLRSKSKMTGVSTLKFEATSKNKNILEKCDVASKKNNALKIKNEITEIPSLKEDVSSKKTNKSVEFSRTNILSSPVPPKSSKLVDQNNNSQIYDINHNNPKVLSLKDSENWDDENDIPPTTHLGSCVNKLGAPTLQSSPTTSNPAKSIPSPLFSVTKPLFSSGLTCENIQRNNIFEGQQLHKPRNCDLQKTNNGMECQSDTSITLKVTSIPVIPKRDCTHQSVIMQHLEKSPGKDIPARHVFTFGQEGSGDKNFYFPIGVTVNQKNDVIICDTGNNAIKVFSWFGEHKLTMGSKTSGTFRRPSSVVTNHNHDIFVKDDHMIQVISETGLYLRAFGKNELKRPYGLSMLEDGRLVTLDTGGYQFRIMIFTQQGELLSRVPFQKPSTCTQQISPTKTFSKFRFIATYGNNLVAVDLGCSSVHVIDLSTGQQKLQFGQVGDDLGQFREPSGVTTDCHGNILIADSRNNRVQVFKPDGTVACQVAISGHNGTLRRPSGIHLTDDGHLLIMNYLEHRVKAFKIAGCLGVSLDTA